MTSGPNPYDPTQMAVAASVGSAHRVIGTLNIVFACILSLCGLCTAANVAIQYATAPMIDRQQEIMQQSMNAQMREQRQREIEALETARDAAANEEDKAALDAQIQAKQQAPMPQAPDMKKMMRMSQSPTLIVYTLVDSLTGLALNVAMFAAGVGLLSSREWARRLGIWVAGLKIGRLLIVYTLFLAVVVPAVSRTMQEMFDEMIKANPPPAGGPPPAAFENMGMAYAVMMTIFGVATMIVGVIYPAISIWILTRRNAKIACGAAIVDNVESSSVTPS